MNETNDKPKEQALVKVDVRAIAHGADVEIETYDGRSVWANANAIQAILPGAAKCTKVELGAFLAFCQANKLDPFRRQVHLIKYKDSDPAAWVVSWEVFLDRAERHPQFDGFEAGIVWRVGSEKVLGQACDYPQDNEHRIAGSWFRGFRKDQQRPVYEEIPVEEMVKTKYDGTPTRAWSSQLTTMCKKVAKARGLRQLFPEQLSGQFIEEEIRLDAPNGSPVAADVPTRDERAQAASEPQSEAEPELSPTQRLAEAVLAAVRIGLPVMPKSDQNDFAEHILPALAARATGDTETDWSGPEPYTGAVCDTIISDLDINGLDPTWLPQPQEVGDGQ